jgi:hypothetical protein
MPGSAFGAKPLERNGLQLFSWCPKSDPGRFELPEPPHSAMAFVAVYGSWLSSPELRFQPVPARSDIDDKGNGQLGGALHLFSHELRHHFHFGPRHLEDQFVVHL